MRRLIDADALIEAMGDEPLVWNDEADEIAERMQWQLDMSIIEEQPIIETCEDAISIEVAIQTTWMILNGMGYPKDQNEDLAQTIKTVFNTAPRVAPSRPRGEWISTGDTDNYPRPFQNVLVCDEFDDIEIGHIKGNWFWLKDGSFPIACPVAWMPLPEPYKESE